ncbi:MAG TPA: Gfo/Idh/MocA family oxidoreductase [Clostridia bacterium]|jgi:predicted dehydrogenase
MIKIGLIGAGFMGSTHLAAYAQLQNTGKFQVTAIADLIPERAAKFAEKLGAKTYTSGQDLLDNADVNTIDICLPTYLHFEYAKKALEKGYNVFVEKPLCRTSQEANELAELAEQKGVIAMVGQCIRFWDEYVYLKEIFDSKVYGNLVNASFKRLSPRPLWGWQSWLLNHDNSGGAALDLHVHDTDYLLYLFGAPNNVKTITNKTGEKDSYILSIFDYDKFTVSAEGTWDLPSTYAFEMYYRAVFEKAVVEFSSLRGLKVYTQETAFTPELKKLDMTNEDNLGGNISDLGGYYNELQYFTDCLAKGEKVQRATLKHGAEAVAFIEKELESKL